MHKRNLIIGGSLAAVAVAVVVIAAVVRAPFSGHASYHPHPATLAIAVTPTPPAPTATATPGAATAAAPSSRAQAPAVLGATAKLPGAKTSAPSSGPKPAMYVPSGSVAAVNVVCDPNQITIKTAYLNLDASPVENHLPGHAEAYIDFNDGTTSPLEQMDFEADIPSFSLYLDTVQPFHVYAISPSETVDVLKYRIRVVKPNTYTSNWGGWGNMCPNRPIQ